MLVRCFEHALSMAFFPDSIFLDLTTKQYANCFCSNFYFFVYIEHCKEMQTVWHSMRRDIDDQLYAKSKDEQVLKSQKGFYLPDVFKGHCAFAENKGYLPVSLTEQTGYQVAPLSANQN